MLVSAIITVGDSVLVHSFPLTSSIFLERRKLMEGEAIPSWLGDVGTDMYLTPFQAAVILATSRGLPPPTPSIISPLNSLKLWSDFITSSISPFFAEKISTTYPSCSSVEATSSAILLVISPPVTKKALFPKAR